jgi:hypothetical protein
LGILLLILAACIGALFYDYKVAKPGSEAANEKLKNLVETRNRMSVKEAGPVTDVDVHKALGRKPTWVEEEPTHTIEWYCWWGKTPLLSVRRHYLTVLYIGEKRRFSAQQLNGPPAEDDLPTHFLDAQSVDVGPLEPPSSLPTAMPPGGLAPRPMGGPPGMGGKGMGKGKGKRGSSEQPPSDAPAPAAGSDSPESTAIPPATDKPAGDGEKPADDSDKPAAEKPTEDKPAEAKPEEKGNGPADPSGTSDKPNAEKTE